MLMRKIKSARFKAREAVSQWKKTAVRNRKRRRFDAWLTQLRSQPPDVLIGTNFAEFGGVRHHIHAIQRYSSLRVELAPSDELMRDLVAWDFESDLKPAFMEFSAKGMRAIHSHVFPWFIEWCGQQKKSGARWIHTYHLNYFPEHAKGELADWQKKINHVLLNDARHADVRISVARWQQADLKKQHGIETIYIPNGVDVAVCEKADAGRFTKKINCERFVLYVGRNDPVKNPADFVRLAERLPGQKFVMIGQDLNVESLKKDWAMTVPKNLYVHGPASHAEVQDAIAACSALVVTSKKEGLPTLVLEGMTHAKPVIVPDEAGSVEAIGDETCGFIYRQNSIDDLAEKTLTALTEKKRGTQARQRVLREYDWRVVAPKLDAIYRGETVSC